GSHLTPMLCCRGTAACATCLTASATPQPRSKANRGTAAAHLTARDHRGHRVWACGGSADTVREINMGACATVTTDLTLGNPSRHRDRAAGARPAVAPRNRPSLR